MKNSVHPLVSAGIIVLVVLLVGFVLYKAMAPPQYSLEGHNGQPYGDHMPPASHFSQPASAPAASTGHP